jgi:hypothetical protein
MHEPYHKYLLNSEGRLLDYKGDWGHEGVDAEVMFSTGLTDADGTEIWEGDLVALKGPLKGYIDDLRFENEEYGRDHDLAYPPGPVRWIDGRWYLDDLPLIKELKDCETRVVGDKYRDPNLQVTAEVFA